MKRYLIIWCVLCNICCTENVKIDFGSERSIVVNCLLTDSDTQTLWLTYSNLSRNYIYSEVDQAEITLFEDDVDVGVFDKTGYAEWQLSHRPKEGSLYRLHVKVDDKPLIYATTKMPGYVDIARKRDNDTFFQKHFEQGDNDIYWVYAFDKKEDVFMSKPYISKEFKLFDEIGTSYNNVDGFNEIDPEHRTPTTAKSYLAYIRMLQGGNREFYIEGGLYCSIIVFMGISDEYDKYLKSSMEKMLVYQAFDDPSQWLDESEIYTNVVNGLGIFGAYTERLFNYNHVIPD